MPSSASRSARVFPRACRIMPGRSRRSSSTWTPGGRSRADFPQKPISRFRRDVDLVVSRESTIEVYVRDRDPELAAAIANAMIDYFNEFNRDILVGDLEHSIASIGSELDLKDEEIAEAIQSQGAYLEEHEISSLATRGAGLEQTRLDLEASLRDAKIVAGIDR